MKTTKNLNVWLAMSMFLLLMVSTATAEIIFVDADANGANDGSSWTDAYRYLQDTLAAALSGDEIWVAQGTYRPDRGVGITPGDRTATFQLKNGVAIKGGYAGFGEPDPNERDIDEYETILSGDLSGDDVDVNDPVDLLNEPTRAENSYHVVTGSGTDANAILDGFTITGGNANGSNWRNRYGGGMYTEHGSTTVMNCTFSGNSAEIDGGGMSNRWGSSPTLTNCSFSGNAAVEGGGGVHNQYQSSPTITNCTFSGNGADYGGGMLSYDGTSPTMENCMFSRNSAENYGGGMFIGGSDPLPSSATLTNCTFAGNSAPNGNALACNSWMARSNLELTNCILWDGGNEIWNGDGSTITITFTDVQEGWPGDGNIDADPCFVDLNNGDYHLKSEGWRWDTNRKVWTWDDVTSPCIDAGNPGCALGDELLSVPDDPNNEWGENLRINMGAYGGTAEASMGLPGWALLADLTNDRIVDFNDLAVFVNYWLETGECIPSDLNRSQSVDFVDFAIFARQGREYNYILLEIYSDGWGGLLETATMKEEGQITILVYEEEPYNYPPAMYYVYASRDGYYTEIYYCEAFGSPPNNFITVDVDLDPIVPTKFNGTIFLTDPFFTALYLADTDVNVIDGDTVVGQFRTDEQGRFAIEIEPGNYDFEFISGWQEYRLEPVSIGGEYQDFFFPADIMVVLKPNIYLYPEETIELDVDIVFPHGGRITTSIPDYNDGWHITVEPSGIIDGQFEYLFYESLQPDYGQYAACWVVIREQLEDFFRNNMGQTGFNQKEIDDFIEYWIPILTEYPYYAIYPQYRGELEEMIKLEFSAQPESLIRLIYSVRGLEDNNLNIQEPVIPPFSRDGFTVTEWGVILK